MSTDATGRALSLPPLSGRRYLAPECTEGLASSVHTDGELLDLIQRHDEDALLTLFRRYNRLAFSIGCRILRDEGEAEDLVQEVFLRLYGEKSSFDSAKGSARTWIIQMIYRRALDRRAYLERRYFYDGTNVHEHTNAIAEDRSLEERAIDRLTAQQMQTAFGHLNDKQRETLELFFFEGLKFAEIAGRLREDVGNVRHHYYRGLQRLRQTASEMMRGGKNNR